MHPQDDLSTPEKALAAFAAALDAGDADRVSACLATLADPKALAEKLREAPEGVRWTIRVVRTLARTADTARLVLEMRVAGVDGPARPETVVLRRSGGVWRLAPPVRPATGGLNGLLTELATPVDPLLGSVLAVGLACHGVVDARGGVFAFPGGRLPGEVARHGGRDLALALNPALVGVRIASVRRPAQTVMLFEGASGKPRFRHDGKAVVGFVDGHAARVTPEEARKLVWKP